jgi:hypothetical protein
MMGDKPNAWGHQQISNNAGTQTKGGQHDGQKGAPHKDVGPNNDHNRQVNNPNGTDHPRDQGTKTPWNVLIRHVANKKWRPMIPRTTLGGQCSIKSRLDS